MADASVLIAEFNFLKENPQFEQRPASIVEFLGPDYLNVADKVRPGIRKALIKIFGSGVSPFVISQARRAMFTGAIGIGKGELVTEPVLTPTGWRPIGTLRPGDKVIGSTGFAVNVTGVYPRGVLPTYDVSFSDGSRLTVDGDHIWTVEKRVGRGRKIERVNFDTRTLAGMRLRYDGNGWLYSIPMVEPVHYANEEQDVPIQPYLMGLLMGDGCFTRGTITLAGDDFEVLDYIELPDGVTVERSLKGRDWRFSDKTQGQRLHDGNTLTKWIRAFGLYGKNSHQKTIPELYMRSSPANRLELLRGLMDSDGSLFGRNSVRFSNGNYELCKQVLELVQSLGGTGSIGKFERRGTTEYWVAINSPVNPFKISRKANAWTPRKFHKPMRYVTSVTPSGTGDIVCIAVDAADQLYVTSNFIVTHNTTVASIIIPYMVHWVSCLKNPQDYFNFMDGSRIAFMLMSTSESQAKEVLFGDIKARINHSPWFQKNCMYDKEFKNQLRFPKDVWVLPGNSQETAFEGYNILGGILDEGDSHKKTKDKDYAEQGYDTIHSRIDSRFNDPETGDHRGLLLVIGQMKSANGFMSKKRKELEQDRNALVVSMTIWESVGWDKFTNEHGERDSFWYDKKRKQIVPNLVVEFVKNPDLIEIPNSYKKNFLNNPEKALRDLAGIPPSSEQPFISLTDRIDECTERWEESHRMPDGTVPVPVGADPSHPTLGPSVVATDSLRRAMHIDVAISGEGDALGLAMGHVARLVEVDDELKPYIVFDFLLRIKAMPGTEIILGDVRKIIYELKDERGFKIRAVTMDGFQCLTGDTKVPLLDGRTLTMKELSEEYPTGGVHVYSHDGERIVAGLVEKAWRTSKKEIVEVWLDNGEVVRCTADHRFMLRGGGYVQAQHLLSGVSLMPLYRRVVSADQGFMDNYEQVAQTMGPDSLRWQYTHRAIGGVIKGGYVLHHKDGNHFNNDPNNLEVVLRSEHIAYHNKKEFWTDERRASVSEAISRSNSERTGLDARRRRRDVTIDELIEYAHLSRREVTVRTGWSQDMIYARVREAGFDSWSEFKKMVAAANNHKVVSVVWTGDIEDVYDLQVAKHHNFALNTGVFVHNSTDTRQQLSKRRIAASYLSVDKELTPYYDLREAIYERRVEFPPYLTYLNKGDAERIEIAKSELMQLSEANGKVDHPASGSKDVADAMAGVTYTLMGDRTYRRVARGARDGYGEDRKAIPTPSSGPIFNMDDLLAGFVSGGVPSAPIPDTSRLPDWTRPPGF